MAHHKVLLIDYEPKSIERIVKPLEDAGFTVETATDGLAGIEAFERIQPSLVIIEAMIPKKHGFEVCQEIKKTPRGKRTPVVITTAVYKGRKYRTQALHIYGCDEYVEKPIAEDALVALVRRLIGSDSEPVAVGSTREATVAVAKEATPAPRPATVAAPAASAGTGKTRPKSTSVSAIVGDLTEQEIMDRLDALLPSDPFEGDDESLGSVISSLSKSASSEPAAHPRMDLDPVVQEQEEEVEGASDDGVFHLPDDLDEIPLNEDSKPTKPAAAESHQVVSFEPARSRRNRRAAPAEASAPAETTTPARQPAAPPAPKAAPRPETREQIAPRPAPISEAPTKSASKGASTGASMWIWGAVACVVLLAGAYMIWFRPSAPAADEVRPAASLQEKPSEPQPHQDSAAVDPSSGAPGATAHPEETAPVIPVPPAATSAPPRTRPNQAATNVPAADPKNHAAETRREPAVAPKPVPAAPVAAPVAGTDPAETKSQGEQTGAVAAPPPSEKKEAESGERASPARVPADSDPGPPTAANAPPTDSLALDQPPPPSLANGTLPASKAAPANTLIAEDADVAPIAISRPLPSYTAKARTLRQEGTVVFRVLIDEAGRVVETQLVRGIAGSDLNDAALRAAKQWIYSPARKNGAAVRVWKVEEVAFKR